MRATSDCTFYDLESDGHSDVPQTMILYWQRDVSATRLHFDTFQSYWLFFPWWIKLQDLVSAISGCILLEFRFSWHGFLCKIHLQALVSATSGCTLLAFESADKIFFWCYSTVWVLPQVGFLVCPLLMNCGGNFRPNVVFRSLNHDHHWIISLWVHADKLYCVWL